MDLVILISDVFILFIVIVQRKINETLMYVHTIKNINVKIRAKFTIKNISGQKNEELNGCQVL